MDDSAYEGGCASDFDRQFHADIDGQRVYVDSSVAVSSQVLQSCAASSLAVEGGLAAELGLAARGKSPALGVTDRV